jgi:hypothetical protein
VFTYATGPYDDWHRQAWAGALVLVTIVLVCSLLARFATRRLERMHAPQLTRTRGRKARKARKSQTIFAGFAAFAF